MDKNGAIVVGKIIHIIEFVFLFLGYVIFGAFATTLC
jgi:hypothetical protein